MNEIVIEQRKPRVSLPLRRVKQPRAARVAVLVDADNVNGCAIGQLMETAKLMGRPTQTLAFGSPEVLSHERWRRAETELGVKRRISGGHRAGKNSTDIYLAVECMTMLADDAFDVLVICSSDSDFAPLIRKVRDAGKIVIGASCSTVNPAYSALCDGFVPLPLRESPEDEPIRIENAPLDLLLTKGMARCSGLDGWADMSKLAQAVRDLAPEFSPKKFGYKKFSQIFNSSAMFEVRGQGAGRKVRLRTPAKIN